MKTLLLAAALLLPALVPAAAVTPLAPKVPAVVPQPLPSDPLNATIARLSNGLTVFMSPNSQEPRVTAWIAVRAGSRHDPEKTTGLAHYLEHMLFKGTTKLGTLDYDKEKPHLDKIVDLYEKRFASTDEKVREDIYKQIDAENIAASKLEVPNELDKIYNRLGFRGLNAFTSDEETVYVVDMPSNRLETWAEVESQRFAQPVFRLFQSELEAVYEEKNRSMDNAERIIGEAHNRALYFKHPYGTQPTLGTIEHLKNPSLKNMYGFYRAHYVPNNMALILSGDFDPKTAVPLLEKHFGAWKPKAVPAPQAYPVPKPSGEKRVEVKYEAEEKVQIAWLTAPYLSEDADALSVLDMVMDNAAAGLINLRLVQAQKVKAAGTYPTFYNEAGDWTVWAVPKRGQTPDQAAALLLETVEALKKGDFTDEDVKAVITNFEVAEKARLESNDARVAFMAGAFIHYEPWDRAVGRLDRLRRVTKADVVRVANKYLGGDRVVSIRRQGKPELPSIAKPKFTDVALDDTRQSAFARSLLKKQVPPIEPKWLVENRDYWKADLPSGRLFAAPNPINDLFSLNFSWDRGSRDEKTLCDALSLLELSGAGAMSAEEYKKKLFSLGTSIDYSCDERESGVSISGLESNLWPSLQLMLERFEQPNVAPDTLAKLVDVTIGAHQDTKKNPDAVHHALGEFARRGKDNAIFLELSDAELQKLKLDDLKKIIGQALDYKRRTGYVGTRSPGELAKLLADDRKYKNVPAPKPITFEKPAEDKLLFTHRDMVQARVGVFAPDELLDPEKSVDYRFFGSYLGGGMSSVIFQEIRESRALAYSAWGGYGPGSNKGDQNQVYGGLGCQADKTVQATTLLRQLMQKLPLNEPRFQETARSIEEDYRASRVRFRAIPGALMTWEDQGIFADPRPKRFERVLRYKLDDLKSFAARFEGRPMVTYVLGHRDRVDLEGLKKLGKFEEKTVDQLFPY